MVPAEQEAKKVVIDRNYIRTAPQVDVENYFKSKKIDIDPSVWKHQNGREVLVGIADVIEGSGGRSVKGKIGIKPLPTNPKGFVGGLTEGYNMWINSNLVDLKVGSHRMIKSVASHEYGHNINKAILRKLYPMNRRGTYTDWLGHITSTDIVETANRNYTARTGRVKTTDARVAKISNYATSTRSEALAEAFGKFYSGQVGKGSFEHEIVLETWRRL